MKDFITPADHINFLSKRLFTDEGEIINGSIAYIAPKGGGPVEMHAHEHNHLFIVVSGQAKIVFKNGKEVTVNENEACIIDGKSPHSVWNNTPKNTVMIEISVKPKKAANEEMPYKILNIVSGK